MLNLAKKGPPWETPLGPRADEKRIQNRGRKMIEKDTRKKSASGPPRVPNGAPFLDDFNINVLLVGLL